MKYYTIKDAPGLARLYPGDNLAVMEELARDPLVAGKVRLVYIDPPYGTGQRFTVSPGRSSTVSREREGRAAYPDLITGDRYLEFLHPRLALLKCLLAKDGSIYVHVDARIGHRVRALMDQVFGSENFINDIARIKCNPKNFPRRGYGGIRDQVLFYAMSKNFVWNDIRVPFGEAGLGRLFPKADPQGRRYATTPLHAPGETRSGPTGDEWRGLKPPPGRHWRIPPADLEELDRLGLIEWSRTGNPRKKIYADQARLSGRRPQDVWEFKDPPYPVYPTEKNLDMLKMIVLASSRPGDLALDCFCGSGATLAAAQELGRQWIGIDKSRVAVKVCQKRLGANLLR